MRPRRSDKQMVSKLRSKPNVSQLSNVKLFIKECALCKNHSIFVKTKGHKCSFIDCNCVKCLDTKEKRNRKALMEKKRKMIKSVNESNTIDINKSLEPKLEKKPKNRSNKVNKSVDNSFNKQKTNKSVKKVQIANNVDTIVSRDASTAKRMDGIEEYDQSTDVQSENNDDSPPELVPEISLRQKSSETRVEAIGDNNDDVFPIETSDANCGRYLRAGEDFCRKLSQYKLNDQELVGCLKYSLISFCLGDVDVAAQKIIEASNEIRRGALYNMQNPIQAINTSNYSANNQNTSHSNDTIEPVFNSTFNVNYTPMNGIGYSPTRLHRN